MIKGGKLRPCSDRPAADVKASTDTIIGHALNISSWTAQEINCGNIHQVWIHTPSPMTPEVACLTGMLFPTMSKLPSRV